MKAPLDAIVIAGDAPLEVLGRDEREKMRLTVDGIPASLPFLREYFAAGRDAAKALTAVQTAEAPFVSLNGPFLAQYLESRGFNVAVVPLFSQQRRLLSELLARGPRAVLISTTFLPFAAGIDAIAAAVKAERPDVTVIAGGIQVWKSYRHKLLLDAGQITPDIASAVAGHNYLMDPTRASPVDALIVNEGGEATLAELLLRLRTGQDFRSLDNVAHFSDGRWHINAVRPEPSAEVRVEWSRYLSAPAPVFVPVQSGLGCGFRCTFCDFRGLRSTRYRSTESVLDEIRTIPPHDGVRRVYFTDDNLFATQARAREVCRAVIRSGMRLKWRGMVRIAIVTEEIAHLMAQSGCLEVLLGIESGDPEILRRMRKSVTPDRILTGVQRLAANGIHTKSTFIVGFPGETEQTLRNTVALLNAYPTASPAAHRYLFFTYAVLPLSTAASPELRERYGLRGYGYQWRHDTMNSEEAARRMAAIHDAVRDELSPSYVLEVPELPGLSVDGLKRAFVLRNRLARLRRGQTIPEPEPALWNELEAAVGGAAPSEKPGALT
jgi:p-methyltransferase